MVAEYTMQSLLAAWMLAVWLFLAAAVAQVFVMSNGHWMIRYTLMNLLFVPLIAAQAHELFWMLAFSATLGAFTIDCLRYMRRDQGQSNANNQCRPSFSIGGVLYVTACASGALIVMHNTPALDVRAWSSLAVLAVATVAAILFTFYIHHSKFSIASRIAIACGFGSILAVPASLLDWLLFSLYSDLGWPPNFSMWTFGAAGAARPVFHPEWLWFPVFIMITVGLLLWLMSFTMSWRLSRVGITALLSILIAPPMAITLQLINVPEFPENPVKENAYADLAQLSASIANSDFDTASTQFGAWYLIPPQRLRAVFTEIDPALEQLCEQLERPVFAPIDMTWEEMPLEDNSRFRTAVKALLARGRLRLVSGNPNSAVDDYLSAVQLGMRISNDGLIVQALVSRAFTSHALWEICNQRKQFDNNSRNKLIAELLNISKQHTSVEKTFLLNRISMMREGWHSHLWVLLAEYAGGPTTGLTREHFQGMLQHERTMFELLACELAIYGYVYKNGSLPQSLDDLVPDFLPRVPVDGFAADGASLVYVVAGDSFVLYSVGADQVDNRGRPTELPGYTPDAKGDLSLYGVFENSR